MESCYFKNTISTGQNDKNIIPSKEDDDYPTIVKKNFELFLKENFNDQEKEPYDEEVIKFIRNIGHGSFSQVSLCLKYYKDKNVNNLVVKKTLKLPTDLETCENELIILKRLKILNSIHFIDLNGIIFDENKNEYSILINYGYGSLFEALCEKRKYEYNFLNQSDEALVAFLRILIEGLHILHSNNIVHHDIKLDNIIIASWEIEKSIPKYADFNVSVQMNPNIRTRKMEENGRGNNYFYPCKGNIDYNPYLYDIRALVITMLQWIGLDKNYNLFKEKMFLQFNDIIKNEIDIKEYLTKYPLFFYILKEMFDSKGDEDFLANLQLSLNKRFGSPIDMYRSINMEIDKNFLGRFVIGSNGYSNKNKQNDLATVFQTLSFTMRGFNEGRWMNEFPDFKKTEDQMLQKTGNNLFCELYSLLSEYYCYILMISSSSKPKESYEMENFSKYLSKTNEENKSYEEIWEKIQTISSKVLNLFPKLNIHLDSNLIKEFYGNSRPLHTLEKFEFLLPIEIQNNEIDSKVFDIIYKFSNFLNENPITERQYIYVHFLFGIGIFHQRNYRYSSALYFFDQLLEFFDKYKDFSPIIMSLCLMNKSQIIKDNPEFDIDQSLFFAKNSHELIAKINDKYCLFYSCNNLSILYNKKKNYKKSEKKCLKTINFARTKELQFTSLVNLKINIFYSKNFNLNLNYDSNKLPYENDQKTILEYFYYKLRLMEEIINLTELKDILYDHEIIKTNNWLKESIKIMGLNKFFYKRIKEFKDKLIYCFENLSFIPSFMQDDMETIFSFYEFY